MRKGKKAQPQGGAFRQKNERKKGMAAERRKPLCDPIAHPQGWGRIDCVDERWRERIRLLPAKAAAWFLRSTVPQTRTPSCVAGKQNPRRIKIAAKKSPPNER